MLRNALAALAAIVLVGASLMPDDAFARRGFGGGGYRGGGGFAEVRPISGAEWFMAVVTASLVGDMVLRDAAMRIAE